MKPQTPLVRRGTQFNIGGLTVTVQKILRSSVTINFPDGTTAHLMRKDIEAAIDDPLVRSMLLVQNAA